MFKRALNTSLNIKKSSIEEFLEFYFLNVKKIGQTMLRKHVRYLSTESMSGMRTRKNIKQESMLNTGTRKQMSTPITRARKYARHVHMRGR